MTHAPELPSEMEIYKFDLKGFLILKGALSKSEVRELNACIDEVPPLKIGEWYGYVHAHNYGNTEGLNLQQIYEAGKPFEDLIDHPSWIEKIKHFVGGSPGSFDWKHGPLFIDECFANIRGPGEAIGLHSGGHTHTKRTQFHFHNGDFRCGQVNILMALNDIGPGDGATMVIPGSHKANFPHPQIGEKSMGRQNSADGAEEAIEVHLEAGDAILFVDAINHGSAARVNEGQRRICVYRYGPSWGNFRHGYQPSAGLLERLTEEQRQIVQPQAFIPRTPNKMEGFDDIYPTNARLGENAQLKD